MSASYDHDFGTFDGEAIRLAAIRLTGGAGFGERLEEGERIVLVVTGTVGLPQLKRDPDGRLIRVHPVKVDEVAPPADELAEETARFLAAYVDELEGRTRLPFEEDPDAALDEEDGGEPDEEA